MGTLTQSAVLVVLLLAVAAGCRSANPEESRLVGIWESERGETIEFTEDGSIHTRAGANQMHGHWELLAPERIRIRWDRTDAVIETAVRFPRPYQIVLEDVSPGVVYTKQR